MNGDLSHQTKIETTKEAPSTERPGDENSTVRRFNAQVDNERLQIPTGHIYGAKDVDCIKSVALLELCEERGRFSYVHQGGHNIPLLPDTSRKIADIVQAVVQRSEILC